MQKYIEELPKSAKEARLKNTMYYFNNKPCPNGHVDKRYTKTTNCVICDRERSKQRRKNNRERCIKLCKEWHEKNRDYVRYYNKKRSGQLAVRCRTSLNQSKHGKIQCTASIELISAFTGICCICGISENECGKRLCMDHCHETGSFRGWICDNCNVGLARFKDNINILKKAISYLEDNKSFSQNHNK